MTDWRELKTGLEVFQALEAGDDIECDFGDRGRWVSWEGISWSADSKFRARPRKRTKTVVLREALFCRYGGYNTDWCDEQDAKSNSSTFVRWLDTPERVVEVDCE